MNTSLYFLMAMMIGVLTATYLPMNSSVARHLGSPLTATITFYSVALVTAIIMFTFVGNAATLKNLGQVPLWLFLTGVASAFTVFSITFLIPKIGPRQLSVLSIAGQLTMAMIISHMGVLEAPKDPVTVKKVIGATLLFAGAVVSIS